MILSFLGPNFDHTTPLPRSFQCLLTVHGKKLQLFQHDYFLPLLALSLSSQTRCLFYASSPSFMLFPHRGMFFLSFPPIKILLFFRLNSHDSSTIVSSASNRMTPEISYLFEFCLYYHYDKYPSLPLTVLSNTYVSLSN